MRSYIGAYKILARVIPQCSGVLSALEGTVANRSSTELIQWDDDLINIFKDTQNALSSNKVIALPRPTDHLWIVTDAAVKNRGIGGYTVRNTR